MERRDLYPFTSTKFMKNGRYIVKSWGEVDVLRKFGRRGLRINTTPHTAMT